MNMQSSSFSTLRSGPRLLHRGFGRQRLLPKVFVSLLAMLLTGCNDSTIILKQIEDFNAAVQVGADYTALYYKELNEQDRRLYAAVLALNPACIVGGEIDYQCGAFGQPPTTDRREDFSSPLEVQQIPEQSIQARIALLKALAKYAKALGELASDSSPETFSKNIDSVRGNFVSLQSTFGEITRTPSPMDKDIDQNYLTPIATIVKILGTGVMEQQKWNAVRQAIISADPSVRILLESLRNDLNVANYLPSVRERGAQRKLISYYNSNRLSLSLEKRRELLAEILSSNKNIDILMANNPALMISDLADIHKELVRLARSDGGPVSIGRLKAMMDNYLSRIADFKAAVLVLSGYKGAIQ